MKSDMMEVNSDAAKVVNYRMIQAFDNLLSLVWIAAGKGASL